MTLIAQQDESVEVMTGRTCRVRCESVRQMASQASLDAVHSVVGEHTIQLAAQDEAIACLQDGLQATSAKCDSVDIAVAVLQRDNRVLKSKLDFLSKTLQANIIFQNRENLELGSACKRKAARLSEDSSLEDEVSTCSSSPTTTHIVTAVAGGAHSTEPCQASTPHAGNHEHVAQLHCCAQTDLCRRQWHRCAQHRLLGWKRGPLRSRRS